MLEWLIKNAKILDGSGEPAFYGDVAVDGGAVAAVGDLRDIRAAHTLDAGGKVLTPGFLDIHRHGDTAVFQPDYGKAELLQGITTVVNGNCGMSAAPVKKESAAAIRDYLRPVIGEMAAGENFETMADYLQSVEKLPLPLNLGMLAGGGVLRADVAGFRDDRLTERQLRGIHTLLERALGDGALGVSLGLGYAPECFYTTEELIAALEPLRDSDTVIAVHMRQEGDGVTAALREMLAVTEALHIPVEISHLKAIGRRNWRRAVPEMLGMIARARETGLDISCDVYPYTAGATQLIHVLPPEFQSGGLAALTGRLRDPDCRDAIKERMKTGTDFENITLLCGFENVHATGLRRQEHEKYEGKSIAEIAAEEEKEPFDVLFDLLASEECTPSMIDFITAEKDIAEILRAPFSSVISDAIYPPEGLLHPRVYGMTAHLLEHFVRETRTLTLSEAVNRLTRRPADRLSLYGKGRIAVGADADLCLFDPERIHEAATYADPRRYVCGMEWVFVNGIPAVAGGEVTGSCSGKVLRR